MLTSVCNGHYFFLKEAYLVDNCELEFVSKQRQDNKTTNLQTIYFHVTHFNYERKTVISVKNKQYIALLLVNAELKFISAVAKDDTVMMSFLNSVCFVT